MQKKNEPSAFLPKEKVGNMPDNIIKTDLTAEDSMRQLTEALKREDSLKQELKRTKLFFKEFRHRVNNNLQLLTSMLQMKSMVSKNREVKEILESNIGRIQAIIQTQSILGQIDMPGKVGIENYMYSFLDSIKHNIAGRHNFTAEIPQSETQIKNSDAVLILLAINELVTNALEHAFTDDEKGTVAITVRIIDNNLSIIISDNGKGMKLHENKEDGIGLGLVKTIVEGELKGTWSHTRTNGTTHTVFIPLAVK
jgi:two-component sensor histidine kinase